MKLKLLITLLTILLLFGCKPPVIDPEPPPPDPSNGAHLNDIEGLWVGVFSAEEGFFFTAAIELEFHTVNNIRGEIELLDEIEPTFGDVEGRQVEDSYFFEVEIVNLDEIVTFDFNGTISEGRFFGEFQNLDIAWVTPNFFVAEDTSVSGTVRLSKRSER